MNTHSPVFRYAMIGAAIYAAYTLARRWGNGSSKSWSRRDETLDASFPASDPPPF